MRVTLKILLLHLKWGFITLESSEGLAALGFFLGGGGVGWLLSTRHHSAVPPRVAVKDSNFTLKYACLPYWMQWGKPLIPVSFRLNGWRKASLDVTV